MYTKAPTSKQMPLNIVGSTTYGRYPKISTENTYNMFISDGWLVDFAGYLITASLRDAGIGRGLFNSARSNKMVAVVDKYVYLIDSVLTSSIIGTLDSSDGDVFIDENDAKQIAICDKKDIYIYDYNANTFGKATIGFIPGYITFQDGYFIAAHANEPKWELSALNNGLSWPAAPNNIGAFQTKPDNVVACVRLPGRGGQLFIMGNTVTEHWVNVGYQIFPYQRTSSFNIDYGCLNPATIATGDTFIVWLGANEKSGPAILLSNGTQVTQISTDGINYKLGSLVHPEDSYGFLYKLDGHLFYQLTFSAEEDNLTLLYDLETKMFFTLTDENMNKHIAKRLVFFNDGYYFLSFTDGFVYRMSTDYVTYNLKEIPRVRICKNIRMPDSSQFIANSLLFTLEQGASADIQRVDLSVSTDGGVSFGSIDGQELNDLGVRHNKLVWWNLGWANDFVAQFRFWGKGRFVATDGMVNIYQ